MTIVTHAYRPKRKAQAAAITVPTIVTAKSERIHTSPRRAVAWVGLLILTGWASSLPALAQSSAELKAGYDRERRDATMVNYCRRPVGRVPGPGAEQSHERSVG